MFSGLFNMFYSKILIGIHFDGDLCQINILRTKNNKIKQSIKTEGKLVDGSMPMEIFKLIYFYQKKYPLTYIGMMSKTQKQGAIPANDHEEFIKLGIKPRENLFLSFNKTWSTYIDRVECERLKKQTKDLGSLDYLFSPFVFIFIHAQKKEKIMLYAIQERDTLSVAVCDNHCMYYGKTFSLKEDTSTHKLPIQKSSNSLDQLLDHLDHFELQDAQEKDEELTPQNQEEENKIEKLNDFVRATFVAKILENTLAEYYATQSSVFIDEIILLDSYGITLEGLNHIQETLLIDVHTVEFSISNQIASLMLNENRRS